MAEDRIREMPGDGVDIEKRTPEVPLDRKYRPANPSSQPECLHGHHSADGTFSARRMKWLPQNSAKRSGKWPRICESSGESGVFAKSKESLVNERIRGRFVEADRFVRVLRDVLAMLVHVAKVEHSERACDVGRYPIAD
jgi:hypothetical protein